MLDGIYLEKESIPAAVISTELFVEQTKTMASIHGFENYPFVEVFHPIATANPDQLKAEAKRVVQEVISLLVG